MKSIYVLIYVLHITPTLQVPQKEVGTFSTYDECAAVAIDKSVEHRVTHPEQAASYVCKNVRRDTDAK